MQHGPLAIATASLLTALLFAAVTRSAHERSLQRGDKTAHVALACAWGSFAFMAANDAARILLGTYWPQHFDAYSTLAMLKIVANGVLIWGLGVYVAHLWLGHTRGWRVHLATYAAAHSLFFLYAYHVRHAVGATPGAWVPRLVFDGPAVLPPLMGSLALALYFVPPLVLVIVFAAYGRTLAERAARHRVQATSIAIAAFQVANMYQSNPYISGDSVLFPLLATLTLLSGIIARLAHRPDHGRLFAMGHPANPTPGRQATGLSDPHGPESLGDTLK